MARPVNNPHHYFPDGQLNWAAIKDDYRKNATPEELKYEGMTDREVMEAKGWRVGEASVTKAQSSTALTAKPKPVMPNETPIDTRMKIVALYTDGKTVPEVSAEVSISQSTVRKILQNANVYDAKRDKGRAASRS